MSAHHPPHNYRQCDLEDERACRRAIGRWEHEFRAKLQTGLSRLEAAHAMLLEQPETVRNFLTASLDAIDPRGRERCRAKGQTPQWCREREHQHADGNELPSLQVVELRPASSDDPPPSADVAVDSQPAPVAATKPAAVPTRAEPVNVAVDKQPPADTTPARQETAVTETAVQDATDQPVDVAADSQPAPVADSKPADRPAVTPSAPAPQPAAPVKLADDKQPAADAPPAVAETADETTDQPVDVADSQPAPVANSQPAEQPAATEPAAVPTPAEPDKPPEQKPAASKPAPSSPFLRR